MRVWHEKIFQYSCSFPAQVIVKVFYESAESMQALLVQKDMRWTTFLVWYFEENKDSSFEILSTRFYKAVLKKQSIHLDV